MNKIYCEKLFSGLDRRLEEKKSIDEIAAELCPGISKSRDKVIKIIKMHRGGQYLIDNYEWLGYHKYNIRNPTGRSNNTQSKMLFRPSLSNRKPSDKEYKKWLESLTKIVDSLASLYDEIKDTTEGRHMWKVSELKKSVARLHMVIKAETKDVVSDEVGCKCAEEEQKYNKTELHRKIFEIAKEQINLVGQFDATKISEKLKIDVPTAKGHIKKMNLELAFLIKKWQDEQDKSIEKQDTTVRNLAQ